MEIEILHAFSPLLVVAWDQSGSLPQTPEWYQATLTGPLVSVGGCRALSESVYPPYGQQEEDQDEEAVEEALAAGEETQP